MKLSNTATSLISLALLIVAPAQTTGFFGDADTSKELRAEYPDLESNRTGNPLILCPFLRLLERSGRLDDAIDDNDVIKSHQLNKAADDFGCDTTFMCGPVVAVVSTGQKVTEGFSFASFNPFRASTVDLERLWDAPPISHECAFTFENGKGEEGVSATRLSSSMARFANRADADGHLVYADILSVKTKICDEESVEITSAGRIETRLIFSYLGGNERGYVEYTDVEGFLQVDTQMPQTKAAKPITLPYLLQVK